LLLKVQCDDADGTVQVFGSASAAALRISSLLSTLKRFATPIKLRSVYDR
jgi:hypothetical protein